MGSDEHNQGRDDLDVRLDELATFETYTPFSQLYCRLVVAWSREAGFDAETLRSACGRLFDIELWYHQTLAQLSERQDVTHEDVRSVADKRRINLTALAERINEIDTSSPRATVVKHLLLGECHHHLREIRAVVADIEAAIGSGGGHPLVHFALGYNWFDYARELLTAEYGPQARTAEHADREFRSACFNAVKAFRDGLTGQAFDAQLHFWIGRALAAAGLLDEAEAALETAVRIDPDLFGLPAITEQDQEGAPGPSAPPWAGGLPEDLESPPPPISEDEVRRFGELLKGSWERDDLLPE
ncbi:MAG: tetratricopeptide repeat protein [Armatimonadetes bacterium]|nr:tetratricopeptide repeat protein [Armatimonadota bacterium]